jgi:hypothetical protein
LLHTYFINIQFNIQQRHSLIDSIEPDFTPFYFIPGFQLGSGACGSSQVLSG